MAQKLVPEAKNGLSKFKTEVANEMGVPFTDYNGNLTSNLEYKPSFISNNPEEGKKVISSIEEELLRCEQFQISVAFITMGGITPLLQTLKELERKRIPGQILTTNYLDFSEPRALAKLNELNEKSNPPAMLGRME